jgi:hypothetical protein
VLPAKDDDGFLVGQPVARRRNRRGSSARPGGSRTYAAKGEWTGELVSAELKFKLAAAEETPPASETPKAPAASEPSEFQSSAQDDEPTSWRD